jgi:hypothetical protein
VTQAEDALAIAFRTGLPFVGLRDHAHDPDLDRLVPPDAARTARAIPLSADDDRIRLAVADPDTDLSTLDRYLAGRQVDLALAPREEIDTILGPPPPPGEEPPEAARDGDEAAAPAALIADSESQDAGPEAVTLEGPPPTDIVETDVEPSDEPDPVVAESETERVGEPQPIVGEEAATTEPSALEPEPVAAEAGPEPVAVAAQTEHPAQSDADAELAGEVPSWLEPRRRRWWRVVLAVLIVLVVLAVAAVAVVAFVNA